MKRVLFSVAAAALSASVASSAASAGTVNIVSDNANSTENLGSYEGSLTYDSGLSLLTVVLKNTTTGVSSARLTGFVFNIDGNATATFVDADNLSTAGFNESAFNNTGSESASPFGTYDFGAAIGGNFLGGGSPNPGIGIGGTGTFQFNVSGPAAGSLDVSDFFVTENGETSYPFVVRFKAIDPGGRSDKVPGTLVPGGGGGHVVPLPPAAWSGLATMALSGFYMGRRKLKALMA
jgi:hypothetical protein